MSTVVRPAGAAPRASPASGRATVGADPDRAVAGWLLRDGRGLFLLAIGCFSLAVAVWRLLPPVGPGGFPLSSLFLLLGLVAAAGATVAFFLGRNDPFGAPPGRPANRPAPRAAPTLELGRPRPDVRKTESSARIAASSGLGLALVAATVPPPAAPLLSPATSAEPWAEDEFDSELPPLGPPVTRTPVIEDALAELDRIERDIGPRGTRLAAESTARA